MVIIGRIILLGLFILAVYLPLRGFKNWQGSWRFIALLPFLPLLVLFGYAFGYDFSDNLEQTLSPEVVVLALLGSLLFSVILGLLWNKYQAKN